MGRQMNPSNLKLLSLLKDAANKTEYAIAKGKTSHRNSQKYDRYSVTFSISPSEMGLNPTAMMRRGSQAQCADYTSLGSGS